jgi:hypothetical protein
MLTDLDEGAVLAGGALEGPGLLGARHAVHPDIPVLARCQDVLPTPEHGGSSSYCCACVWFGCLSALPSPPPPSQPPYAGCCLGFPIMRGGTPYVISTASPVPTTVG